MCSSADSINMGQLSWRNPAVLSIQTVGINGSKFDAPQADRFSGDSYASFSQEIFDIPMTEIETVVEPDGITDDIGRESVPFIRVHGPILTK